jgi:hypothetical protein
MSDLIFNQTCEVDEENVEFYFKATRGWNNPPSKDEIREDLKNPLKHVNYMYPEVIVFKFNGDSDD